MSVSDSSSLLRAAAQRAATQSFFVAGALAPVISSESLDEMGIARRLGCPIENVPSILLCRRPRKPPAEFRADVYAIAERFGADPQSFAEMIRQGDALAAFASAVSPAFLAAARDRNETERDARDSSQEERP
jgi:hypothetical protein